MTKATKFNPTHKGWFGICPVHVAGIDGYEEIQVQERHLIFLPLLWVSMGIIGMCIMIMSLIDDSYIPAWPIKITGRVKNGRT